MNRFLHSLYRIYLFGGGQQAKARFNDVFRLRFSKKSCVGPSTLLVEKVIPADNSPMPSPRTYHASCLVNKYMVTVGGEANSDLKDFWAFDLDSQMWFQPELEFHDFYTPKRFHTLNTISDYQVVSFGGCHSEYAHLNEMHIFDMSNFLADPICPENKVIVTRINITEGVPSTRWGHAAATNDGKLYILGGRNDQDICDLHEFDPTEKKWREIAIADPKPKPRRRHSVQFVCGSLVMFGGFDGNFFDDLHILDMQTKDKSSISVPRSTLAEDYLTLVNSAESADIIFELNDSNKTQIYGHRALILFRLM